MPTRTLVDPTRDQFADFDDPGDGGAAWLGVLHQTADACHVIPGSNVFPE